MKKLILISILIISRLLSFGQTKEVKHPIDISLENCLNKDGTTSGMISCLNISSEAWDKELNQYYQKLILKLNETDKKNLQESQRKWIKFRDDEFKFIDSLYSQNTGTMWPLLINDNKYNFIKNRALDLKSYYDIIILNSN